MAASILEVFYELASHAGKLGLEHAFRRLQSPAPSPSPLPISGLPSLELPILPQLPQLPTIPLAPELFHSARPVQDAIPPTSLPATQMLGAEGSYADEMDSPAAACLPCTRAHVSCMAEAARAIRTTDDPDVWRTNMAVIAGEALVMQRYDWAPGKIAKACAKTQEALGAIHQPVEDLVAALPAAPQRLVLAWAATSEAVRFARSVRMTQQDLQEIQLRMRDVEAWLNYLERVELTGANVAILQQLRAVRHSLAKDGYSADNLEAAAQMLQPTVVAMTPVPDASTAEKLTAATLRIRDEFFRRTMASLRKSLPLARAAHKDVHTKVPTTGRALLHQRPTEAEAAQILEPPESPVVFGRLESFATRIGIPIRWRSLPSTFEVAIEGQYSPDTNIILLAPAAMSRDNYATQTLTHELGHALLHNQRCNIYDSEERNEDIPEEQEADLVVMVAFTGLGLPIEFSDGSLAQPGEWEVDWTEMRQQVGEPMAERVRWAASLLVMAGQNDVDQAATGAGDCPRGALSRESATPKSFNFPPSSLVARFNGIIIRMFIKETGQHNEPHFHAEYGPDDASYGINTLEVLAGELPQAQHKKVIEWARTRQKALMENWARLERREYPLRIK